MNEIRMRIERGSKQLKGLWQESSVGLLLALFLLLNLVSVATLAGNAPRENERLALPLPRPVEVVPLLPPERLSEVRVASIGSDGAMIVKDAPLSRPLREERVPVPPSVWAAVLFAYAGLLIFSLAFDFRQSRKLRYGLEIFYTLLFLGGWVLWDPRGESLWFPIALLQAGLLIYAIYLLFFREEMKKPATLF